MCVYIYIYIYTYTCMYTHIYTHMLYIYVYIYIYMYTHVCICMCVSIYIYIYTYTHVHVMHNVMYVLCCEGEGVRVDGLRGGGGRREEGRALCDVALPYSHTERVKYSNR